MRPKTYTHKGITYILRGKHPSLMIWSGTHGDETEVTECVTSYIESHQQDLPDYLYIPEVSPSAVKRKTRRNKHDRDLNRHFHDNTIDEEAKAVMEIVRPYSVPLGITFHEDPDRRTSFYMYDSDVMSEEELKRYRSIMLDTGAKLYTGIDDEADENLRLHVEEGYITTTVDPHEKEMGYSMNWLVEHKVADRIFIPEVPGKADMKLKHEIVDGVFRYSLSLLPKT